MEIGNPVFSIWQTDIVYYGYDLVDYLAEEFNLKLPPNFGEIEYYKPIRFWSYWAENEEIYNTGKPHDL
jgi:hypothetical protein